MGVPALGRLLSIPVLVAFLLWPAAGVISLPVFLVVGNFSVFPVAFI